MRQFIIASHAHFARGIAESIGMLAGERENVSAMSLYVDGVNDLKGAIEDAMHRVPADAELVICTDLMGEASITSLRSLLRLDPIRI